MFISSYYWSFKIKPKKYFDSYILPSVFAWLFRCLPPPPFICIHWGSSSPSHFFYFYFYFAKKLYFCIPSFFLNPLPVFSYFSGWGFYIFGCYKVAFNSHNWFCLFSAIFCCVYWLNLLFLCLAIKLRFYNLYFPRSVKIGVSFFWFNYYCIFPILAIKTISSSFLVWKSLFMPLIKPYLVSI